MKNVKSIDVPNGTQFQMECQAIGMPTPTISWFKDSENIDNSPDYVITQINGVCTLKVRKALESHTARYSCKASNAGGEATSAGNVKIISKN